MSASGSTATVVVVVIDLTPARLPMTVPTYLPAADLTQRIARDAGLDAFWPDGSRRTWTLRARGRILEDEERLGQLGVGDGELVWLLPEPPAGSPALERARPSAVEARGGAVELAVRALGLCAVAAAWAVGAASAPSLWSGALPAAGVGVLCSRLAARAWGGRATAWRVPVGAAVVGIALTGAVVFVSSVASAAPWSVRLLVFGGAGPGLTFGLAVGWLASLGPVDPLPMRATDPAAGPVVEPDCGVCGGPVAEGVRAGCARGCGLQFHAGCLRARQAVARGDACAVCGR